MKKSTITVAVAVASTVVLWLLARLLGADLRVEQRSGQAPDRITLPFAVAVTLVVSLLGWATRAVLSRVTRRAAVAWTVVAVAVLPVSLLPVLIVGASGGTRAALAAMHLAVAAVLIPGFRTAPAPTRHGALAVARH